MYQRLKLSMDLPSYQNIESLLYGSAKYMGLDPISFVQTLRTTGEPLWHIVTLNGGRTCVPVWQAENSALFICAMVISEHTTHGSPLISLTVQEGNYRGLGIDLQRLCYTYQSRIQNIGPGLTEDTRKALQEGLRKMFGVEEPHTRLPEDEALISSLRAQTADIKKQIEQVEKSAGDTQVALKSAEKQAGTLKKKVQDQEIIINRLREKRDKLAEENQKLKSKTEPPQYGALLDKYLNENHGMLTSDIALAPKPKTPKDEKLCLPPKAEVHTQAAGKLEELLQENARLQQKLEDYAEILDGIVQAVLKFKKNEV